MMEHNTSKAIVADDEQVARLVSQEWLDGEFLMPQAFAFAFGETYLSVNRTSVDTYDEDVRKFIAKHPSYSAKGNTYHRALLNVNEVRAIKVCHEGHALQIDIAVQPRDAFTKSHAGIFVLSSGKSVVAGRRLPDASFPAGISTETILQQVQWELHDLATLQERELTDNTYR